MFTYKEAENYITEQLLQDIESHLNGLYTNIGDGFEYFDLNLPRDEDSMYDTNYELEFTKLFIALNFWDAWQDARSHEWQYYDEISKDDWTKLAQKIIESIQNKSEITDSVILKHFSLHPSP